MKILESIPIPYTRQMDLYAQHCCGTLCILTRLILKTYLRGERNY